jgi:hypothetical protein
MAVNVWRWSAARLDSGLPCWHPGCSCLFIPSCCPAVLRAASGRPRPLALQAPASPPTTQALLQLLGLLVVHAPGQRQAAATDQALLEWLVAGLGQQLERSAVSAACDAAGILAQMAWCVPGWRRQGAGLHVCH